MYIQLTDRCNMSCAHCCFAATRRGTDMDRATFMQALQVAANLGDHITLGGGEPTLHKEFFAFLDKAIELHYAGMFEMEIFMVTNGKLKTKALKLLDYIEDEAPIAVELSQDVWHDPIDPAVVSRFRTYQNRRDRWSSWDSGSYPKAGIRTVNSIVAVGRAKDWGDDPGPTGYVNKCACEDLVVDPLGNVFSCGCKTHLLGNIWEGADQFSHYDREEGHKGGKLPVREHARLLPQPLLKAA